MTSEPPRQLSPNAVQASGQVASDVISGLKAQPALLAVVVLNVIALGFASWFLGELAENNRHMRELLMQACFPPSHQPRDFGDFGGRRE